MTTKSKPKSVISTKGFKEVYPNYPFKAKQKKVNEPQYFESSYTDWEILKKIGGVRLKLNKEQLKIIDQAVKSRDLVDIQTFLEEKCNAQNFVEMNWDEILERLQAHQRLAEQSGSSNQTENIQKRFGFNEGQAFFDGKDLGLPTGEPVDILKKLVDSVGQVVKHYDLDLQSNKSNASDSLRKQITILRKALKKGKIPYKIQTNRGVGYTFKSH